MNKYVMDLSISGVLATADRFVGRTLMLAREFGQFNHYSDVIIIRDAFRVIEAEIITANASEILLSGFSGFEAEADIVWADNLDDAPIELVQARLIEALLLLRSCARRDQAANSYMATGQVLYILERLIRLSK
jgi:hypothetical protein